MTEPTKPTIDIPLSTAVDEMTGFEVLGIQKKYGKPLEHLSGTEVLIGTVWAFENRTTKVGWPDVESRSMRELGGYFADEPVEPDDEVSKE